MGGVKGNSERMTRDELLSIPAREITAYQKLLDAESYSEATEVAIAALELVLELAAYARSLPSDHCAIWAPRYQAAADALRFACSPDVRAGLSVTREALTLAAETIKKLGPLADVNADDLVKVMLGEPPGNRNAFRSPGAFFRVDTNPLKALFPPQEFAGVTYAPSASSEACSCNCCIPAAELANGPAWAETVTNGVATMKGEKP